MNYDAPAWYNNFEATWAIYSSSYRTEYTADAGAPLLTYSYRRLAHYPSLTAATLVPAGIFYSAAAVAGALVSADIVIDETYEANDYDSFLNNFNLNASSTTYKFIANKQVWRVDREQNEFGFMGMLVALSLLTLYSLVCADWYEGAVLQIDGVLQDLIAVVHPSECVDHKFVWFRNLPNNDPVTIVLASECTDISAPLALDTTQCKPQYVGVYFKSL